MFDLYGIYDSNEIALIVLIIVVIILSIIIIFFFFSSIKKEIVEVEKEVEKIILPSSMDTDYKGKYEKLIKEKGNMDVNQVKYSPSEFSTLLKYNPILPYSAFTWDIINNSYLDYNEQSNYDDRYFSLSNYDNIYRSYNEPTDSATANEQAKDITSDTEKLKTLTEKVKEFKLQQSNTKKSDSGTGSKTSGSKTSDSMDKYKDNNNYNI